jgi:hypothetical protein
MHRSAVPLDAEAGRPHRHSAASLPSVGNLVYLASVGLVAMALAGVFFGSGFVLLAPPAGGAVSSSGSRDPGPRDPGPRDTGPRDTGLEARSLVPGLFLTSDRDQWPAESKIGPAAATAPISGAGEATAFPAIPLAPHPAAEKAPPSAAEDALPDRDAPTEGSAAKPRDAAARSWGALGVLAPAARASSHPRLSAAEITELLEHGDGLLRIGDLASARLFYERAAAAGDGRAALRLGATFDPDFLDRAGLRSVKGDAAEARSWYGRALDLGVAKATRQPNNIDTSQER